MAPDTQIPWDRQTIESEMSQAFAKVQLIRNPMVLDAEGAKPFSAERLTMPNQDSSFSLLLTPQMLQWEMRLKSHSGIVMQENVAIAYRNCLTALANLNPFTAVVTMEVDRIARTLQPNRYDMCHIYFQGRRVARFTHNQNGDRFQIFCFWPEAEEDYPAVMKWDKNTWRSFFLRYIEKQAQVNQRAARDAIDEARNKHQPIETFNIGVLEFLPSL